MIRIILVSKEINETIMESIFSFIMKDTIDEWVLLKKLCLKLKW